MKIEQRFTGTGWAGIAALFLGPCLSAFGYWSLGKALARNITYGGYLYSDPLPWIIVFIAGGILSLLAFPLMIIGREFEGFTSKDDLPRHREPSM